ncbi:MAG: MFS transporter [Proteobacteria bacterium]|nr:MFS transporter [Pseudomonadota bacterium]NIS70651.1 MFS transporter [Pseudomonadota bacterium]
MAFRGASIDRIHFIFLSVGHFYDHLFMLVFATVAALSLSHEWGMSYGELIPYATPGFIAFGLCSVPAGWLADKWNRKGMMVVFYIGIGLSSIFTALAETPLQIGIGLFAIGLSAAIYHPVGVALVVQGRENTGVPLAINGIFGNMGVACAALITGFLIDHAGWRSAFVWPGVVSIATGIAYAGLLCAGRSSGAEETQRPVTSKKATDTLAISRRLLGRVFVIIFLSTALGGFVFQSTTFTLPKVFDERLAELAISATLVGWYAFMVFAIAAFGQLVVGYLVDHYSIRSVFALVAGLQAICFAVMLGLKGWSALGVSIAFMLVVFGQIPINDVLIARITRSEWRSRVYAFRYIVTFSVMASSVPLIAWIHMHWGFDSLFIVLAAAAASIFTSVLMLPRALPAEACASRNPQ